MKLLLTILSFIVASSVRAQDSTMVTINIMAKDLELIGFSIFSNENVDVIYDSTKVKFRVQNPPNNSTTSAITAYTIDWVNLYVLLNDDRWAVKSGASKRVHDLLIAVNQPYLTGKIDAIDSVDNTIINNMRARGRKKLTRN